MALGDAYQESTDAALSTMAALPLDPVKPEPKHSGWTTVPRAVISAGAEIGANLQDIAGAYGKSVAAYGAPSSSPFGQSDAEKAQSEEMRKRLQDGEPLFRNPMSEHLYGFSFDLRPDPMTAGVAENLFYGVTKGLTKAIGSTMLLGPMAGAGSFGVSEGLTTAEDLATQGVDLATRTKVGALTGVLSGASVALPAAGNTWAQTVGLAVAGGPASFIAQQEATKQILVNANYGELAQQYDPLDPVGLTVSTLIPLGFGAWAMRGAANSAKASKPTADTITPKTGEVHPATQETAPAPTPEQLDAVMTHNLTLQRDLQDHTIGRLDDAHLEQLHPEQADKLRTLYREASDRKPVFDSALTRIADSIGAKVELPELKSSERAVHKAVADYAGNAGDVKDILRGTIVAFDIDKALQAVEAVKQNFEIQGRHRNLFDPSVDPMDGYRDAKFNVLIDGHVAEAQINIPEMLAVKKRMHDLYKQREVINRSIKPGESATPEQHAERVRLNAEMKAAYSPAWSSLANVSKSLNMPSDTSSPFLSTESKGNGRGTDLSQAVQYPTPGTLPTVTGIPSTSKNLTSGGNFIDESPFAQSIARDGTASQIDATVKRGAQTEVKIGNDYIPARWALVESDEIAPTIKKADNQYRDRTRAISEIQISENAANIDFKLLNDSPIMDFGAPTLAQDGRVIGGNGRVAFISRAYDTGTGEKYRAPLLGSLKNYGLDAAAVGMKKPMLVRVLDQAVDLRRAAVASNEGGGMRMSALEQAKVDAERVSNITRLEVRDDGEINTPNNRAFIRDWTGAFPTSQKAALLDSDGYLSAEGLTRLRNAVLYQAYGDSPALTRLVESTSRDSLNVANALIKSAPSVAEARGRIADGSLHPLDIMPDLISAVDKLSQLKAEGKTAGDYLAQSDIFGDGMTQEARYILAYLEANARSGRAITDMITGFYDRLRAAGNPAQADMLGTATPTKADLLESSAIASGKTVADAIEQQPLFSSNAPEPKPAAEPKDPLVRSMLNRVEEIQKTTPDMAVAVDDSGNFVSAADELDAIRKQVQEGTDSELGAMDSDLVQVAADCFLSMGGAA